MKITLINTGHPNSGLGRYSFELFSSLKKKYKNIRLLNLYTGISVNKKGVLNIKPFPFPTLRQNLNEFFYYPKKIINNSDLYHFLAPTRAIKSAKKPFIVTVHDIFYKSFWRFPFVFQLFFIFAIQHLNRANRIIVNSHYTKKEIVNRLSISNNKIVVIHYGLDHLKFRPRNKNKARRRLNLPSSKKIILHIGDKEKRKNFSSLIKAFYYLNKRLDNLVLLKIGPLFKKERKLIKKLRISDIFINITSVDSDKIKYYYNAADIFVFPSLYEGFGLPPLEAMASGCPVISSNRTSLPEVVGKGGILVDPEKAEETAEMIFKVLSDNSLEKSLIKKGLSQSRNFSWKLAAKKTFNVYRKIYQSNKINKLKNG